jgi:nucleoid-associated protein YgaU
MFARGSRYADVPERIYTDPAGREHPFKLLRLVPESGPSVRSHRVLGGDRLDLLADAFYGDAEQFWRICDGNRALRPDDLIAPGRRLLVPTPLR